jgi:DNA invertase Pin-like site-specific DNA recombinase
MGVATRQSWSSSIGHGRRPRTPPPCGESWSVTLVKATNPPIAATYSRVSNPNDVRDASLDTQEEAQIALWEKLGYTVPSEYRFRERYTGMESIYDRPVLNQLRDLVAAGRIQGASAYDTDRLARDPSELLTVVRDNMKHKVETKFVRCDHALEGRIGELILYMKGFASALEYDAIRDRTMRGTQKIRQQGLCVGGGAPKYGLIYVRDQKGRLVEDRRRVADPETAPVLRRIFQWIAEGVSTVEVAARLNAEGVLPPYAYAGRRGAGIKWWQAQISHLVRDRIYIGEPAERKTVRVEGRYPCGKPRRKNLPAHEHTRPPHPNVEPLVSRELFDRANQMLTSRRNPPGPKPRTHEFLLRGVAFCGVCGHRLIPHTVTSRCYRTKRRYKSRTYRCIAYRRHPEITCRAAPGAQWIESRAWRLVEEAILDPGRLERMFEAELKRLDEEDGTARMASDLKRAEDRRKKMDVMMKRLIESKLEADDRVLAKAYDEKLVDLGREAGELDRHIAGLRLRIEAHGERRRAAAGTLTLLGGMREAIERGIDDPKERRDYIDATGITFRVWTAGRRLEAELPIALHSGSRNASPRASTTG